ncbi:MAG: hypothetical protein IMY73_03065 [Bacteroidetes bacterium]|nr:hypothetical protein [Bacteroidota bacterium]
MISKILVSILNEKDSVTVPKKGLIVNVNIGENTSKAFVYNPSIDYKDIIEQLQKNFEVDVKGANIIIDGYCALMDSILKKEGEFLIEGVGTLYLDNRGIINMSVPNIVEEVEAVVPNVVIEEKPIEVSVEKPVEEKVEIFVEALVEEKKVEEFVEEKKVVKHFDESMASHSNVKKLDTILGENKHKTFDSAVHQNTLGDKFAKNNVQEQPKKVLPIEEKDAEVKSSSKSDNDKLTEIFSGKRGMNSNKADRNDANFAFAEKEKKSRTMNDVLSELEDKEEVSEKPIHGEESSDLVPKDSSKEQMSPEDIAKSIMGKNAVKVKGKKKIDAVTVLFIVSITLFLLVLAYYFMFKNGYDLFEMISPSDSGQIIEEMDMNI